MQTFLKSLGLAMVWLLPAIPALAQMPVNRVVIGKAKMLEAPATITVVGTVEPLRRSRVGSEIAGMIESLPVREGDTLHKGDVISRLNNDTLSLRLAEEQARLAALKARHEELLAGTRHEDLVRLKALLDEAKADDDRWQFEMRRIAKLYEGNESNTKEYNDTRADYLRAERRRIAAEANYNLAVEGPRKEVIARAAHEVAQQQAVVDRIRTELDKTTLHAPISGSIVERLVEVGEWIDLGDVVVEMIDLSSVLVRIDVPETALPYLTRGAKTAVKIDALRRTFSGKIKHIMRQADRNARTFPVQVEVANEEGLLAAGMFARVTIPSGPKETVLAVPKDAVVERGGVPFVAMILPGRDGQLNGILAPVTLGADVGAWVAITSGQIRPGAQVIVKGTERVLPFPTPVLIVDDRGTPVAMPTVVQDPKHDKGA